jgi:hypothetical protein
MMDRELERDVNSMIRTLKYNWHPAFQEALDTIASLRKRVSDLENKAFEPTRAEKLIAAHEGIEHQGLNKGLVEALIFDQGMDPYSALALLRENKGKS